MQYLSTGALSYVLHQTLNNFAREQIECEQVLATQCGKKFKDRNWKLVRDLLQKDENGQLNNSLTVHEKIRILYLFARSKAACGGITIKELIGRNSLKRKLILVKQFLINI